MNVTNNKNSWNNPIIIIIITSVPIIKWWNNIEEKRKCIYVKQWEKYFTLFPHLLTDSNKQIFFWFYQHFLANFNHLLSSYPFTTVGRHQLAMATNYADSSPNDSAVPEAKVTKISANIERHDYYPKGMFDDHRIWYKDCLRRKRQCLGIHTQSDALPLQK